ncbi:hypothetical protein BDK51DRAFT_21253, partial [Blyttiomyces helicus]
GLISPDPDTLVTLGGCSPDYQDNGQCLSHRMESPTAWLGIAGLILMTILLTFRVKGGMLFTIVLVSAISWFRNTSFTYFPHTQTGDSLYTFFTQVVAKPQIHHTAFALNFDLSSGDVWLALITFLYVDILDTTGTMFSMAKFGGFLDPKTGDFENSYQAFCTDAASISIGALLGSPPCTTFIESGAGITEGGRTGLTAITCGFFFVVSLFFAPIFASFPPWATGPALISVGVMMAQTALTSINWQYLPDAFPAFITIAFMPFTYSIADGLIAGIGSYIAINTTLLVLTKVSGGKWVPANAHLKEKWGPKSPRDLYPFWVVKMMGPREEEEEAEEDEETATQVAVEDYKHA